jgi:hypothetical protein
MACLQQANPTPEAEAAMAYLRVATALVEEKSVAAKSVASSSSRHSRSRSNQPARSNLPPHLALRRGRGRRDAQGRPRQHRGAPCGRTDALHPPRVADTSLPRPQHAGMILQHGRPSPVVHPRHQGNAQALHTLGRPFHREIGHWAGDL